MPSDLCASAVPRSFLHVYPEKGNIDSLEDGNSLTRAELLPGLAASLATVALLRTKDTQVKYFMFLHNRFPFIPNIINFIIYAVFRYGVNSNHLGSAF